MFSNKRRGKKVFQNENEKSFSSSKNEGILWTMSSHSWSKTFCKYVFHNGNPKTFSNSKQKNKWRRKTRCTKWRRIKNVQSGEE